MSNNEHPITPPLELVQQWRMEKPDTEYIHTYVATQAARWGADQELEACCALMDDRPLDGAHLRAARRPKPPSLKKQALEILDLGHEGWGLAHDDWQTLRRALQALPE